jgi:hypothetical protein
MASDDLTNDTTSDISIPDGKVSEILEAARRNPVGLQLADLIRLLEALGFEHRRTSGSHRIFRAAGLPLVNLQDDGGGMAKTYQVRQVLRLIEEHGLEVP